MRDASGSRLRRGLRRGDCRVCHRRDGAMRRCPCRVSARLAVVMRALRSEAEAGARVASALDCTVVVLAPPLDPAGSIRGNVMANHVVAVLADRARRRDGHSVHCIEGCVNEPRHRGVRRRLLSCVPTSRPLAGRDGPRRRRGTSPRPTSRVACSRDRASSSWGSAMCRRVGVVHRDSRCSQARREGHAKGPAGPRGAA